MNKRLPAVRFFKIVSLAAFLAGAGSAVAMPEATLVVEREDNAGQALGRLLEKQLKDKVELRWLNYSEESLGDPIYKGKLVASLTGAKLVVCIGDEPTSLALGELEDTPVYFVGASLAPGAAMASPQVAGLFSYSPDDILAAMPKTWQRGLGLLYSRGYEPIVELIRTSAKAAGFKLLEREIVQARDIPPAVHALMGSARAVWILGDPMLSRGAGFEFLAEQSLTRDVPLVSSGPWEVRHGAVFCSQAAQESMAEQASKNIVDLLRGGGIESRIEVSPGGGKILFKRALAARFGVSFKKHGWTEVR